MLLKEVPVTFQDGTRNKFSQPSWHWAPSKWLGGGERSSMEWSKPEKKLEWMWRGAQAHSETGSQCTDGSPNTQGGNSIGKCSLGWVAIWSHSFVCFMSPGSPTDCLLRACWRWLSLATNDCSALRVYTFWPLPLFTVEDCLSQGYIAMNKHHEPCQLL